MNAWTTPEMIRARVQRYWDCGELLASIAGAGLPFPLRVPFRGPSSRELSELFEAVRTWIARLESGAKAGARPGYRLTFREVNHRVIGVNRVPMEVWIDTVEDALAIVGKQREAQRYRGLLEYTEQRLPAVIPWLLRRPLRALELAEAWKGLLCVTVWMQEHPRPGVYLRQIDVEGVHSKFIEEHKGVLSELFDLALPESAIDSSCERRAFEKRYGFREKPGFIRFRVLDERKRLFTGSTENDIAVTAETFARLDLDVARVFITENEINFLAFPEVCDGIVVFGAGYGFERIGASRWLQDRKIYYWGDIDTHGFAILDSLRAYFANTRSFLMNHQTLLAHRAQWTEEAQPVFRNLERLTSEERHLFDDLRTNRFGPHIRLEQEKVGFHWVSDALKQMLELEQSGVM